MTLAGKIAVMFTIMVFVASIWYSMSSLYQYSEIQQLNIGDYIRVPYYGNTHYSFEGITENKAAITVHYKTIAYPSGTYRPYQIYLAVGDTTPIDVLTVGSYYNGTITIMEINKESIVTLTEGYCKPTYIEILPIYVIIVGFCFCFGVEIFADTRKKNK